MKLQSDHVEVLETLMLKSAKKGNLANAGLVLEDNNIVASSESLVSSNNDATAHSERMLVSKVCKLKKSNYTPGLTMITVVEPCTMCLSACSQASYSKVCYIIPAEPYISRFPYVTDGVPLEYKVTMASQFTEKVMLKHLREYEDSFRKIFEDAMKDLFLRS